MKLSVLLHGPWTNNCFDRIFNEISSFRHKNKDHELSIYLVSYRADFEKVREFLNSYSDFKPPIENIIVKDLFNPGFYNINRQIHTVLSGLSHIDDDCFVIKLRNDQTVDFSKLINLLKKSSFFRDGSKRFLTTNCYTRKDRLYHPSDMFLAGWRNDLFEYYDVPFVENTSAEYKMKMLEVIGNDPRAFQNEYRTPESYLFTHYLRKMGWRMKDTSQDSFDALDRYFYIANSWDLDYRWNKARPPKNKRGSLILPMFGSAAPFGWDTPIRDRDGNVFKEEIVCYEKSDFTGIRTKKDEYYIDMSRRLFKKFFNS